MPAAKILVIGPPEGPQSQFVSSICEVKVRSSARTTSGEDTVPMDFGRVRIGIDLDLQLFGFDRDRIGLVADAVAPGIVGAVVLSAQQDEEDPFYTLAALDELASRGITAVVAVDALATRSPKLSEELGGAARTQVVPYATLDKETVKSILLGVLEAAVLASEGSAA
jgi:signal recognition particle receptor subunit beta